MSHKLRGESFSRQDDYAGLLTVFGVLGYQLAGRPHPIPQLDACTCLMLILTPSPLLSLSH
jgi:hypothetical protein